MKQSAFDAVAASREWKQAVAQTTAGMTIAERMAWFRSQSSVAAVASHISGTVTEICVKIGESVESKDLLVRLGK